MLARRLLSSSSSSVCGVSQAAAPFLRLFSSASPRIVSESEYLLIEQRENTRWITMQRPQVHNAFDDKMIEELTVAFQAVEPGESRAVVLASKGPGAFSAGADMNWMRRMKDYSEEQNREDSLKLFDMFAAIKFCPAVTIARGSGHALGGGCGLVSVCDIPLTVDEALFGFTEVKLGLIPAVISRFVMDRIGKRHALKYFLTGERFSSVDAMRMGLVHRVFPSMAAMDRAIATIITQVNQNSPAAMKSCKELIEQVSNMSIMESRDYTTSRIAAARVSAEGQEGLSAFLEKRKPSYVVEK